MEVTRTAGKKKSKRNGHLKKSGVTGHPRKKLKFEKNRTFEKIRGARKFWKIMIFQKTGQLKTSGVLGNSGKIMIFEKSWAFEKNQPHLMNQNDKNNDNTHVRSIVTPFFVIRVHPC